MSCEDEGHYGIKKTETFGKNIFKYLQQICA